MGRQVSDRAATHRVARADLRAQSQPALRAEAEIQQNLIFYSGRDSDPWTVGLRSCILQNPWPLSCVLRGGGALAKIRRSPGSVHQAVQLCGRQWHGSLASVTGPASKPLVAGDVPWSSPSRGGQHAGDQFPISDSYPSAKPQLLG